MSSIKVLDNTSGDNNSFNEFSVDTAYNQVKRSSTIEQKSGKNKYLFSYSPDYDKKYITFNNLKSSNTSEALEQATKKVLEVYKAEIIEQINLASEQENKIKEQIKQSGEIFEEIDKRKNEFTKETIETFENIRNSIFTTIAMFAAFFAFISVSFNAFSKVNSTFETISLILIMWSCIIGFLGIFFIYLYKVSGKEVSKTTFSIVVLSFISSIVITYFSLINEDRMINYEKLKQEALKKIIKTHQEELNKVNKEIAVELKSKVN